MKKLITLFMVLSTHIYAAGSEGGVGVPVDGEIISITQISENLDNVCYQTEDNNITCVIVERD